MTSLKQLVTKLFRHGAKPLDSYTRHLFHGGRYFLLGCYSGDYDPASVDQMEREIVAAFRERRVDGLVLDFSGLTYAWGDDLLRPLSFHPDVPALDSEEYPSVDFKSLRPFSVAYIVSDSNRESLNSLIAREIFDATPEEVLFGCQNDAVRALQDFLDKEGCAKEYPSLEEQRHTPRPTTRVKCRKCPAMILEATAKAYHGTCPACARTKGFQNRLKQSAGWTREFLLFPFFVVLTPFYLAFGAGRIAFRKWRFPFDKTALFEAIDAVHHDADVSQSYLNGVIQGYWESSGLFYGFGADQANMFGRNDGGQLRRGETAFADIPTERTLLRTQKLWSGKCSWSKLD